MEIAYKMDERGMMLPELEFPEEVKPGGKYGSLRQKYLLENRRARYDGMLLDGTLNGHLQQIQDRALDYLTELTERMERENPPPESLTFQERTAHFREIHLTAEQLVLEEIVYAP